MIIKVSEIFKSIQGEGKYSGNPMLFIRLSGCTRKCWYCDTKYHIEGKEMDIKEIIKEIAKSKLLYVCWTGGEPLLQREAIREIRKWTSGYYHHLETNGDLLEKMDFNLFHYLAISPKEKKVAEKVAKMCLEFSSDIWDIKIVTDLKKEGIDMLKNATMLMPLSTYTKKDLEIQRKVWDYCVKNNLKFTPRYQFWIWQKKRGV